MKRLQAASAGRKRTPALSLRALVNELLGKTGFIPPMLYLSDGGILNADSRVDVVAYARRDTGFPQETTGDQWFSQVQFKRYRRLGETITGHF